MSRRNNGRSHKLDLKLNLSLPMRGDTSRRVDATVDGESSPSSCLTSENEQGGLRCPNSPEATSMVLAACPRCLMYVMLPDEDPKCPKCKKAVILDFLHTTTTTTTNSSNNNKKSRKS